MRKVVLDLHDSSFRSFVSSRDEILFALFVHVFLFFRFHISLNQPFYCNNKNVLEEIESLKFKDSFIILSNDKIDNAFFICTFNKM